MTNTYFNVGYSILGQNQTCETGRASFADFFLLSLTEKQEYSAIPNMATRMPNMFRRVKGSCNRVQPNDRTKHVLRWPSTWYVTGDVVPITRNVLKFTDTAIKQDRTMKPYICVHTEKVNFHVILCPKLGKHQTLPITGKWLHAKPSQMSNKFFKMLMYPSNNW